MDSESNGEAILKERIAEIFYNIAQSHSKKIGMEYSLDKYEDIHPDAKEFYRAFAVYVISRIGSMLDVLAFYADERNWMTIIDNDEQTVVKDGVAYTDAGDKARQLLIALNEKNAL